MVMKRGTAVKLIVREGIWYISGTVLKPDGTVTRMRRSTGIPRTHKPLAEIEMTRIVTDLMAGRDPNTGGVFVREGIRRYLNRPTKPGQTDQYFLGKMNEKFGGKKLPKLDKKEVMDFVFGGGVLPNTIARRVTSVNAMLNYAEQSGIAVPSWRLKKPRFDDARDRWLTEDERDRLIEAIDVRARALLVFLFFTGARFGEATGLTFDNVVSGAAMLKSRKGAAGKVKTRAVPLLPIVQAWMDAPDGGYVFKTPEGKKWDRTTFSKYFREACDKAKVEDFRPHDCRHTFASLLIQKGASLREVAELLGHSRMDMVMRYSHLAPTHLNKAIGLLDKYASGTVTDTVV
jgi:integrase